MCSGIFVRQDDVVAPAEEISQRVDHVYARLRRTFGWWEGNLDKRPKTRAEVVAHTHINRHDFGVSWNLTVDKGGIVIGNMIQITIDVEAILV